MIRGADGPAVHYFSPLPPVRSGIADYSQELLPHLAALLPVRVASAPGEPTLPGEIPLYQMGNNVHHAEIYARALRQPGVVVLHDTVLHHLIGEVTLRHGMDADYLATMAYGHGTPGAAVAQARLAGVFGEYQQFLFPGHALLADRSLAVVVHSHDAEQLLSRGCPGVPVFRVPMGVPLPPAVAAGDVAAARDRLGIPRDAFVVASFGFVSPIKRVDSLLRAFADLAATHPSARLHVVGEILPFVDPEGLRRELGLEGRALFTDYVPFDTWLDHLVASDVCVNLRFPTAGETSASLIRILGHGKPVLVSRYRQFRELPRDAAGFVDLGPAEERVLAAYLRALADDPALRERMGRAAREHAAREHTLPGAAAGYARALADVWSRREELRERIPARRPRRVPFARTSRIPGVLRSDLVVPGPWPRSLPAGTSLPLSIGVKNLGDTRWLRNPGRGERSGFVVLDLRFTRDGRELPVVRPGTSQPVSQQWFDLPRDVSPGRGARIDASVATPAAVGPAELEVDLRVVGVGRFGQLGGTPRRVPVRLG